MDDDGYFRDEDCDDSNPIDMLDSDDDGVSICDGDCNDYSALSQPNAYDLVRDGIDQDCDGTDGVDTEGDG